MSREFDDELNQVDDGRRRGRAGKNEYDSAENVSQGRRRASRESGSYDQDYFYDDENQGSGYDELDHDNGRRAPEEYRAGSRRTPEGGRRASGNGRAAGDAGNSGSGRVSGNIESRSRGGYGNERAAGENGSRSAGMPGNSRGAGENGGRSAGIPGNSRAAGGNNGRSSSMAGNGRTGGEGGSRSAGTAGGGRAVGEGGKRGAGQPGNGRASGEGGSRGAGMPGSSRAAGENGTRGMRPNGGNGGGRAAGEPPVSRNLGADGSSRTAGSSGARSMGVAGSYRGGEPGGRGAGVPERGRNTAQDGKNGLSGQNGQNRSGSRSAAQAAKKKKVRRIVITAFAEILALFCIFSYAYVLRLDSRIKRPGKLDQNVVENPNLTPAQKQHMTGYKTIAVFGVDSRDGNVHKGTNADVIMLCNINRDTGEIRLVSVYRDTYLNTDEKSTYNKINSAYSNGGAEQTLAALNRNLDLDVRDYVTFNWKAVADGINMLNGVDDVNITKAEFRYINSFITETVQKTGVPSYQLKSAGVQHLDGVQAVAYGRLRLMDTDYARTERQRIIIQKAFDKAKTADLGLLNRILLMEVEQIETSLSFSDFTELILDIGKYHIGESGGFPMALGAQKMGKKGDCVIPQTLESNVIELHKLLYDKEDYQPSDMVKKISAKIAADSGMYKTGSNVDSHIPSDKAEEPKETEKATKKETDESSESIVTSEGESETDEDGNPIETTKPGETTDGTKPTKPGETADGTKPTKPGETEEGTKPTKPGETTGGETKPTIPGETSSEDTRPTVPGESNTPAGPGETTGGSSRPSSPGETESVKPGGTESPDNTTGPGITPGGSAEPSSSAASEPTSAGLTGPSGSGGSNGTTPGGNDNIVSEGPPGAA